MQFPGDLNSANYFDTDNIKYSSIDIGHDHACGIVLQDSSTTDRKNPGEMICKYGINANLNDNPVDIHLQAVVPNGYTFQSVTAGRNHTCGLVLDSNSANNTPDEGKDTVRCWGNPSESPDGTFKSIVAGHSYTCGVKTDDTIECWGANPRRPAGLFEAQIQIRSRRQRLCVRNRVGQRHRHHTERRRGRAYMLGERLHRAVNTSARDLQKYRIDHYPLVRHRDRQRSGHRWQSGRRKHGLLGTKTKQVRDSGPHKCRHRHYNRRLSGPLLRQPPPIRLAIL